MSDPRELEAFLRNSVKARLAQDRLALIFTVRQWRTIDIARTVKSCGYDGLYVDMEHSAITFDATAQICTAALEIGLTPLVLVTMLIAIAGTLSHRMRISIVAAAMLKLPIKKALRVRRSTTMRPPIAPTSSARL